MNVPDADKGEKAIEIREGMLTIFLALNAWNDIRARKIWLWTAWTFGGAGIVYGIYKGEIALMAVMVSLLPGLFFLLTGKLTHEAVGYGDGIVILVMGIYLGLWATVSSIMIALLLAAVWAVILTVFGKKKKQDSFAFLPFLLLGYLGGLWI